MLGKITSYRVFNKIMQNISLIVAMNQSHVIGIDNNLPWHIPEDLKFFKQITTGKPIIMGRKTFESIGRVLPNRTNIIITRNKNFMVPGIINVGSLQEALNISKTAPEVFIIGGGEIFKLAMELANKIYITIVDIEVKNPNVYFPTIDYKEWHLVKENYLTTSAGVRCCFKEYIR
jgi:dihydrofolate reductase